MVVSHPKPAPPQRRPTPSRPSEPPLPRLSYLSLPSGLSTSAPTSRFGVSRPRDGATPGARRSRRKGSKGPSRRSAVGYPGRGRASVTRRRGGRAGGAGSAWAFTRTVEGPDGVPTPSTRPTATTVARTTTLAVPRSGGRGRPGSTTGCRCTCTRPRCDTSIHGWCGARGDSDVEGRGAP